VLAKNGKLGPQLQTHAGDAPCPTLQPESSTPGVEKGKPQFCNGIFGLPPTAPGLFRSRKRNVTLASIADAFSAGVGFDRPLIDATRLTGTFDFTLEFAPPQRVQGLNGTVADADSAGPTFPKALRDQPGLKLRSTKASVSVPVLDQVEKPSAN